MSLKKIVKDTVVKYVVKPALTITAAYILFSCENEFKHVDLNEDGHPDKIEWRANNSSNDDESENLYIALSNPNGTYQEAEKIDIQRTPKKTVEVIFFDTSNGKYLGPQYLDMIVRVKNGEKETRNVYKNDGTGHFHGLNSKPFFIF